MTQQHPLPPGQKEHPSFDRFGLGKFADRFPREIKPLAISIGGDVKNAATISEELQQLPRKEQVSDFHCVTTWSVRGLRWSGFLFSDFFREIIKPLAESAPDAQLVVFRGQDSYACSMQLEDLLAADVMLADTLNGEKLRLDHGAPLRLVAPAHYGYKNVKHIHAIELWRDPKKFRFPLPYPDLMNHPRGRVAYEERARVIPNWLMRPLYRLLMPLARRKHRQKLEAYLAKRGQ